MRVVILAAGVGSRLGSPMPKPLTVLDDGRSIMRRALDNLASRFDASDVSVVVGFKKDTIMEAFPSVSFVYNPLFGETNTSKSLLKGLRLTGRDPVLWLNGDVVFEPALMDLLADHLDRGQSFVAVNTEQVGDEEVKYDLDEAGFIRNLSKQVDPALGEAVGINFVSADDKPYLIARLEDCDDQDYFERGIELVIDKDGRRFAPVDISSALCIEVDFAEDLSRANAGIRD
ncbi:MAG: phosphocholine cytidylyltransferase family protein [Actinomycetota bacterium]